MRLPLVAAALAILAAAAPAAADAPPDRSFARRPVPSRSAADIRFGYGPERAVRRPVYRYHRHAGRGVPVVPGYGQGYGSRPALYPGYGEASPNAGFGYGQPVAVTLYEEAYIGPGLLYNTPPRPYWPSQEVISVRY